MRLVLAVVLAGLAALPLSASAQAVEEGTEPSVEEPAPEPAPEEPAPSSEPASEEPALQLQLDKSGVEVVPSPPRTPDGYTLEEMELRVKRARIGLLSSGGAFAVGAVMLAAAGGAAMGSMCISFTEPCPPTPGWIEPVAYIGAVLGGSGFVGMIVSGTMKRRRRHELGRLKEARYEGPRRVQWDLAQSRLVF